jgi:hypothetical protein
MLLFIIGFGNFLKELKLTKNGLLLLVLIVELILFI